MPAKDLTYGRRTIARILEQLEAPEGLAHKYAEAVLAQAVRNASSKPTPQARMAASVLNVRLDTIAPFAPAGSPSVEVGIGSEFGSAIWPQFHRPPNPRGYWLYPAGEAVANMPAGDQALEDVLNEVIRGTS